ncbi:MAG TPA: hypothetical protein VFQ47_09880 [Nitrososphaera sp.]|nr:hypothetical protein [Nitrososphaera sp.]
MPSSTDNYYTSKEIIDETPSTLTSRKCSLARAFAPCFCRLYGHSSRVAVTITRNGLDGYHKHGGGRPGDGDCAELYAKRAITVLS